MTKPTAATQTAATQTTDRAPLPGLHYPFAPPAPGETVEVAPGVHWLRMPVPFALKHVNVWLVKDGDGWAVVDTGYNLPEVQSHWQHALSQPPFAGRPLTRMIVTHFHPDHVGLAGWMQGMWGPEMWMTFGEWAAAELAMGGQVTGNAEKWLAFYRLNGRPREEVADGRGSFRATITPVPEAYRRIWEGMRISIGGHDWRVIIGRGHAPEHAALYCADLGVLISGDQVLPRITTNVSVWYTEPLGDPLGQFIDSFDCFRPLPESTLVLPSHNRPFTGLHARLDQLVVHHDQRLDAALKFCATPRTAYELIPVLFRRQLDAGQISFAMGESLAHLNRLMTLGEVDRIEGDDGVVRFGRR